MAQDDVMLKAREWRGIRFAEESIAEVADGHRIESIARQAIQRIVLRRGRQRRYWHLEFAVGLLITLSSLIPLKQSILLLVRGEAFSILPFWLLIFAGVGVAVMVDALRTGFYLEVQALDGGGTIRLGIHGAPKIEEIDGFLKSVEDRFGYVIERGVASSGFPVNG